MSSNAYISLNALMSVHRNSTGRNTGRRPSD